MVRAAQGEGGQQQQQQQQQHERVRVNDECGLAAHWKAQGGRLTGYQGLLHSQGCGGWRGEQQQQQQQMT